MTGLREKPFGMNAPVPHSTTRPDERIAATQLRLMLKSNIGC